MGKSDDNLLTIYYPLPIVCSRIRENHLTTLLTSQSLERGLLAPQSRRELSRYHLKIALVESNPDVGMGDFKGKHRHLAYGL